MDLGTLLGCRLTYRSVKFPEQQGVGESPPCLFGGDRGPSCASATHDQRAEVCGPEGGVLDQ